MGMSDGEVHPNAPLALVAAEIRYPPVAERSLGMAIHRQIRDLMGEDWVIHNDTTRTFEAAVGPAGPEASVKSETVGRITSRTRTKIITVRAESLTLEVSDYVHFTDFRDLLERAAAAVEQVLRPDGVSRAGLRYIDEVSVPEEAPDWANWLDGSLMAPGLPPTLIPQSWTGAVQYKVADDQVVVFRYGPSEGPVVSPQGPLRRSHVPEGPVFMLDFDSSWQPPDIPEFSASNIVAVADRLRQPLRGLFDSLIQPDLLEHFRQDPNQ